MSENEFGQEHLEDNYCSYCGSEYSGPPEEFTCGKCGAIGFFCCVPGHHALCPACEDEVLEE